MTYSNEELILAALVADAASKRREAKRPAVGSPTYIDRWEESNPIEDYVPDVLSDLEHIAERIRAHRSAA